MLRYLKYVFLIFGSLALGIMIFFYAQNNEDLHRAFHYKDSLSYDSIKENCPREQMIEGSTYPCFKENLKDFYSDVGLTGVSIGLKLAFSFMEDDKEHNQYFSSQLQKDIYYTLNYLELNNIALMHSRSKFKGFEFLYGGYLSSVRDFLVKAQEFSDNLVKGLQGEKGLSSLEGEVKKTYTQRFENLVAQYEEIFTQVQNDNNAEIEKVLAKAQEAQAD